ncbi:glutamate ABC transporter substrate-binding protein [Mycobacterium sp. 3519A]|uniref:glutamate ABC transporter substrate-binding protein n=1 Tax=Mycobacterium sp. 3519A TaxID=2057184 RepID=UPI001F3EFF2E|nr:glutamate ABC transporter substrate-binding protein [Mycobacterium sp. 3519A]
MKTRKALAACAIALATAGCGSVEAPSSVSVTPVDPLPSGAAQVTAAPAGGSADCDREASLRPGALPAPGAMPAGSTMAEIAQRGRLIVGVDQNTDLFGFRDPATGQLQGFDIDIAREMARAIFGDPDRIQLRVVNAKERESVLQSGEVDLVVRTYSITCARREKVDFSNVYYEANQKILAAKGSGIDSAAALADKRVCAVSGTTSLSRLYELDPRPAIFSVATWTDCLLMLQQGQVDAISTDDAVLEGLAKQDPTVDVLGESIAKEPYGVGVNKQRPDLVRFVNGVLEKIKADGTWQRLYDRWLLPELGPSAGPPEPRYQD